MTGKRKKTRSTGAALGAIIVGFDQQIFRTLPPVQELIAKGQPVRGLSGEGRGDLEVVFPDDVPVQTPGPDVAALEAPGPTEDDAPEPPDMPPGAGPTR